MKLLFEYLRLPAEISTFEQTYLRRMNRIAAGFFIAHLPFMVLIAFANSTGAVSAFVLTAATIAGPIFAMKTMKSDRQISIVMGIASMLMGGLLVHFGQGPIQIEMHFYFFVLLALLAMFANPMVIVAAALTATLHHALLWFFLPSSVFNYDAPIWVVAVHAAFVVLESIAACFIARSFFDNVIGLEKIVALRTQELAARNQDMRMLLDSVEQGFFTIDADGKMSVERSAAVLKLFPDSDMIESFPDLLQIHDPKTADWFRLSLAEVFADIMPIELTIDQMPSRCVSNGQNLSLEYTPIYSENLLTGLAVVISNITAVVEREKLEAQNRELMVILDRLNRDKAGFLEFFQEADKLLSSFKTDVHLAVIKRKIHTLKGNASIFGLNRLSQLCHEIEDQIADTNQRPNEQMWTRLFSNWETVRDNLRQITNNNPSCISLDRQQYNHHFQAILNHEHHDQIARRVARWRLEPTSHRLKRAAEQVKSLASRMGKGNIKVRQTSNGLNLEPESWSSFWSAFIHVIRNAIDHGLESPEDRRVFGKNEVGSLEFTTEIRNERFVISVSDDGRGIDWEKVAETANGMKLPSETHQDLVDALCFDGLSTAESITSTSGRGVGMGSVRRSCEKMGGRIQIESEPTIGTTVTFDFPISAMAPNTISLLKSHDVADAHSVVSEPSFEQSSAIEFATT